MSSGLILPKFAPPLTQAVLVCDFKAQGSVDLKGGGDTTYTVSTTGDVTTLDMDFAGGGLMDAANFNATTGWDCDNSSGGSGTLTFSINDIRTWDDDDEIIILWEFVDTPSASDRIACTFRDTGNTYSGQAQRWNQSGVLKWNTQRRDNSSNDNTATTVASATTAGGLRITAGGFTSLYGTWANPWPTSMTVDQRCGWNLNSSSTWPFNRATDEVILALRPDSGGSLSMAQFVVLRAAGGLG
jgi:hypothetical protein